MKKTALMSLIAVCAFIVLSSFVKLNSQPENNLGKNQDFKSWLTAVKSLKDKVENSHSKTEFLDFLNKTNSALQNENLAKALGLKNEQEIVAILNKINLYKINIVKATPELLTAKGAKIIHQALQENMQVVPPTCWEVYTIRSMNCFSLYTPSPDPEIGPYEICEEQALLNLFGCVDPPVIIE